MGYIKRRATGRTTGLLNVSRTIMVAALFAGCGSSSGSSGPTSAAQAGHSISQLQREATAERQVAEDYLRRVEKEVREGHKGSAALVRLEQKARVRAQRLHNQMCDMVLRDPRQAEAREEAVRMAGKSAPHFWTCQR